MCESEWYTVFFFNETAATENYTLSRQGALPISPLPPPDLSQVEKGESSTLCEPDADVVRSLNGVCAD